MLVVAGQTQDRAVRGLEPERLLFPRTASYGPPEIFSELRLATGTNEWWAGAIAQVGRSSFVARSSNPDTSGEQGVLLVGGTGLRLAPVTEELNKHLLPVAGQPVFFYPLTNLINAGVSDLWVSTSRRDLPVFQEILGTGTQFGISINYHIQDGARGVASAVADCFDYLGNRPAMIALGDTVFVGAKFPSYLERLEFNAGATLPLYDVKHPQWTECVEFSGAGKPLDFHEKPVDPPSAKGAGGLYIFDPRAKSFGRQAPLSPRGEHDVNAINRSYRDIGEIQLAPVPQGVEYFDAGMFETFAELSERLASVPLMERIRTYSPHIAAYKRGNITRHALVEYCSQRASTSEYFSQVLAAL